MSRTLFVSGTGTEVGKTVVSAALVLWALREKISVAYYKPIQCGPESPPPPSISQGEFIEAATGDAGNVAAWTDGQVPLFCSYYFPTPASPHYAAALAQREISISTLVGQLRKISAAHQLVILEGAGGVAVPLNAHGVTLADAVAAMESDVGGIETLLVCHPGLGTLSHTLTAREFLTGRGLRLAGFCMSQTNAQRPWNTDSNRDFLRGTDTDTRAMADWGELPFVPAVAEEKPWSQAVSDRLVEAIDRGARSWWNR